MQWTNQLAKEVLWDKEIANRPQKEQLASELAKHFQDGDVIGVGSGSTSYLTLLALAKRCKTEGIHFTAVSTSIELELACSTLGVPTASLLATKPDWCFDGADEVDPDGNMIKGRGGAMLREKLVMSAAERVYIVIDNSKLVTKLGQKFAVPIEVIPEAIQLVQTRLQRLPNVKTITLRQAVAKDGPVITEQGNVIFDVKFSKIEPTLEGSLKSIAGVIETGLFMGFKPQLVTS
jgi:ribose 5-phosphate isomerase A